MPPKDQRVIDSTYRLVRYFVANAQNIYPILYSALRELVDSNDEKKLFAKLTNYKFKKSEIKQSGITVEELRDNIDKLRQDFKDSENPDKKQVEELKGELSQKDSLLEEKKEEVKRALEEQEKIRELSLQEGEARGRTEEMKILTDVVRETKEMILEVKQDIKQAINQQLLTRYDGEYKDRKIQQLDFKEGAAGLGLSTQQRKEIKKIIKKMAGKAYADSFDLIAGDDVDVNSIFDGLMGIGLSLAIPIPSNIIERFSKMFRERFDFDLSSFFDNIAVENRQILLTTKSKAKINRELLPALSDFSEREGEREKKEPTGKRKAHRTKQGAILGASLGALTGSPSNVVLGGTAGAIAGTAVDLISRSDIPRIASEISSKIVEATPQISVPFSAEEKKYSKEKSLAIMSSIGTGIVSSLVPPLVGDTSSLTKAVSRFWKEEPIELPKDILTEQQDNKSKGLLRPKFIIPSVDILQPSERELAADALEFSAFDFVKPGSEGGEGDLNTNVLKRIQQENNNIRFKGAGVKINSLFGYDLQYSLLENNGPSQETIKRLFLYPTLSRLPAMKFREIDNNLSEFETRTFDPTNMRTAFEIFSPYEGFSDTVPDDDEEMSKSMLFSLVP